MKNLIIFLVLIITVIITLLFNFTKSKDLIDRCIDTKKSIYNIHSKNILLEKEIFNIEYADIAKTKQLTQEIEDIIKSLNKQSITIDKIVYTKISTLAQLLEKQNRYLTQILPLLDKYKDLKDQQYSIFLNQNIDKTLILKLSKIDIDTADLNKSALKITNEKLLTTFQVLLSTISKINTYKQNIEQLKIDKQFEQLNILIDEHINMHRDNNKKTILIALIMFIILISMFSIFYFKEYRNNLMAQRFRSAIENSDNIVVITDYNQRIIYVNQSFTDSTGYTLDEIKGKTPSILKSSIMPKTFYKELNKTIYSGKKWQGEFINMDKSGNTRYEKASILPIFDSGGKITHFLSIKLDITKEVEANQKVKEHEQTILHQSKMASMGEMLENIAHQWRQPLSTITTVTSGMSMQKEVGLLNDEHFYKSVDMIMDNANYLSKTIDDFRNFFKSEKEHTQFNIKEIIQKALNISDSKLKSKFIKTVTNLDDIYANGLDGELMQVILNLYSNSADAFNTNSNEQNLIFTELYTKEDVSVIKVRDNAGGIKDEYIGKVFEPYFTTKHKTQGTGIGLFMSHEIIKNTFKGTIDVHNVEYQYEGQNYKGAEFIIKLPIIDS